LTIEFQGGEPTANWDVLTHIVATAREQNRVLGKELSFSLVTNFSLMTEERMHWLIENRIQVCTSLDGPEKLHNGIRLFRDGNSHKNVLTWIQRFNEAYEAKGLDPTLYRIEALPTITRDSLSQPKAIVDAFTDAGCRAIFIRKLDPFGFAQKTRKRLGYTIQDFLEFYGQALDYIIEQNLSGIEVLERNAAIMLSKAIGGADPNYLDLRTPGGAAIGQLAYHPNGNIYSSDEGRMVAAMGDETFLLGNVMESSYESLMRSPEVKALVLASVNLNEPGCNQCVYQPYCGLQPEYNYKTQGSLSGRMAESPWCQKHKGIFDKVFRTYAEGSPAVREVMERWTTSRPREHFIQKIGDETPSTGEP
jgi:His-Xaa-Ser system radical SAM maturase HxsB